jgi:hypothetical protein
MNLTRITATAPRAAAASVVDCSAITAVIWAAAVPDDQIEHITTTYSRSGQLDIGIFTAALTRSGARASARRLIQRVADTSPELAGWSISAPRTEELDSL